MKKLNNKKGFTIVELVIVIAVIGILAGVLIPTFAGIVDKANGSSAQQEAKSALSSALSMSSNGTLPDKTVFALDTTKDGEFDYYYVYYGNKLYGASYNSTGKTVSFSDANGNYVSITLDLTTTFAVTVGSDTINYKYGSIMVADDFIKNNTLTNDAPLSNYFKRKYTLHDTEATNVSIAANDEGTGYYVNFSSTEPTKAAHDLEAFTSVDFSEHIVVFVPVKTTSSGS